MILHDRSKVHTAKKTQAFFNNHQLNSLLLPVKSPDLNPIEHCFGLVKKKLERQRTRTLKELRVQVRKIWNNLSDDYLHSLCTSMNVFPSQIDPN